MFFDWLRDIRQQLWALRFRSVRRKAPRSIRSVQSLESRVLLSAAVVDLSALDDITPTLDTDVVEHSALTYTITNDTVTITDCDVAATGTLVIPSTIEGKTVTSIGNDAFLACSSLTDVMIGNGVTSIRFGAFRGCTSLTNIFMDGPPPFVEFLAFGEVAPNALVNVKPEWRDNYGAAGDTWYGLIITETEEECDNEELATLVALLAQKDAQIAELEKRPTQNQYDQVVAELDARPTLEDIQETRAGSVVLTPTGNGTVILRMMIEKSSDLSVWENSGESVEVELPLAEGKKFLRFALK